MKKTTYTAAAQRLRPIEGRHNTLVKELRAAFASPELTPDGFCAIEGLRIVEEAIRSGLKFRAVFFRKTSENKAERLIPQLAQHVETLLLTDKLFASAVPSESPQGVAALVKVPQYSVDDILSRSDAGPILAIGGIQDPGNLGTILRSAEAFGAAGAVLGEGTVSLYNSKVIRASAGSAFRLPFARASLVQAIDQMRALKIALLATSSHRGVPLRQAQLQPPVAIFIGNEGAGLDPDILAKMDGAISIPHSPRVESLNAGVAASLILYEAMRQRMT